MVSSVALGSLWAMSFASSMRRPVVRSDEAWFLWVAVRANSGTSLYRGVYYVTTPLAMWLMQGLVWLFGVHLWVERGLASACLTVSVALVWVIARRLGMRTRGRVLLVGVVFLYGAPIAHFASVYSMLAVTLSLGALLMLLRALEVRECGGSGARALCATGVLCGAAFATKPNVGLVAFAAALATLWLTQRRPGATPDRLRGAIGWSATGFALTLAVMMLPFVATDTAGAMFGDVFTGKGAAYLQIEGRSVVPGIAGSFKLFTGDGSPFGENIARTVHLIPCIALALLLMTAWRLRKSRPPAVVAVVAFALVGFAAAAPDFGPQHLTEAMPLLLALPVISFAATSGAAMLPSPRWTTALAAVTAVALVCGIGGVVAWAQRPVVHGHDQVVAERVAQLTGPSTTTHARDQVRADTTELRDDTRGTVFLAFLGASYYYLAAHLRDPTAYDYPARSDLGPRGENGIIDTLHHVRFACVVRRRHPHRTPSPTAPLHLDTYIRTMFRFVEHLNVCDLYQQRAGLTPHTTTTAHVKTRL